MTASFATTNHINKLLQLNSDLNCVFTAEFDRKTGLIEEILDILRMVGPMPTPTATEGGGAGGDGDPIIPPIITSTPEPTFSPEMII